MKQAFIINNEGYQTDISNGTVEIEIGPRATVSPQPKNKYIITINGVDKEVWVLGREGDTYIIGVDGKELEVRAQDPFEALRNKMGFQKSEESQENEVRAPMPGRIIDILVNEGDEIEEGTPLFILEAMKMENIVKSPSVGTVSGVNSESGQTVQKNDVVIKL